MNAKKTQILEEYREAKNDFERLATSGLDILSSTVALRFLCHAELIQKHYSKELMTEFFMLSMNNKERAERYAIQLME